MASGFTLVELIVVVVVLGILAAIAAVTYKTHIDAAHDTKANTNAAQLANEILGQALIARADRVGRQHVIAGLQDFPEVDAAKAKGTAVLPVPPGADVVNGWTLLRNGDSPTDEWQYAVGFDYGPASLASLNDSAGTRVTVVARSATGRLFAALVLYGDLEPDVDEVPAGTRPRDVLADPTLVGGDPDAAPPATAEPTPGP